jgi:hypothetical protein
MKPHHVYPIPALVTFNYRDVREHRSVVGVLRRQNDKKLWIEILSGAMPRYSKGLPFFRDEVEIASVDDRPEEILLADVENSLRYGGIRSAAPLSVNSPRCRDRERGHAFTR